MQVLPQEMALCAESEVHQSWDDVAGLWSQFVRRDLDFHRLELHGRALLEACGDVDGLRALDLGCGEGWCSRELAKRGARVVGVDLSAAQIDAAVSFPGAASSSIEYMVMDAGQVDRHHWSERFDLATACMSLHDMRDPTAVLRATGRVLKSTGRLVCSVPHPFTNMLGGQQAGRRESDGRLVLPVGGYFGGPRAYRVQWNLARVGAGWATIRWSRSLSDYCRMFKEGGFVVADLREPAPSAEDVEARPEFANSAEIPKYLIVVAEPR